MSVNSPALNVGDNSAVSSIAKDINGKVRIQDGTVDLGAHEGAKLPAKRYVTTTGAGTKDGSSWANASDDIQEMIVNSDKFDKVFVAKGTYKPKYTISNVLNVFAGTATLTETPNNRTNSFVLKEGVELYGGFAGAETTENDRTSKHGNNKTILSGDYNGDDAVTGDGNALTFTNFGENTERVVFTKDTSNSTLIDGFTVTGGNANHNANRRNNGGGLALKNSDMIVNSLIVTENFANSEGGGMVAGASATITNSVFSRNKAVKGGAMAIGGTLTMANNTIYGNERGVLNNGGTASISNCIFWGNGYYDMYSLNGGAPTVNNCLTERNIGTNTNGILGQDPLFADAANEDFRLLENSPALNVGDNNAISTAKDINGNDRIQDTTVDMGAHEGAMVPANTLQFDGQLDYVKLPNNITSGITNFTFEAMVNYTDNGDWQRIFDFGIDDNTYAYLTSSVGGSNIPQFSITTGGPGSEQKVTSSTVVPMNTPTNKVWFHIALTMQHNGSNYVGILYINGVEVGRNNNMTIPLNNLGTTTNNTLGKSQYVADDYFEGGLDEVRIWNIARTPAEINANRGKELQGNEAGLVAYYNFNQGFNEADNTTVTMLTDNSPNSNDATLTNFALTGADSNWLSGSPVATLPAPHTFTNGGGDNKFENPANWNTGVVPSDNDNIIVPNTTFVDILSSVTLNNITLDGLIILKSTSTVTSSFIVNGTITGSGQLVTYQLDNPVPTDEKWHLVSTPLSGMSFIPHLLGDSFSPILANNGTHIALGEYTNTPDSDGDWSYPYGKNDSNTYTFGTAKGYAVKYLQTTVSSFLATYEVGTYPTLPVTAPLTIGQAGDTDTTNDNPWNLVGNPFPSRVDIAQFLTDNANVLKSTHQAVYVWNPNAGTDGEYQQLTTGSIEIGQGFFVSAKNATGDNISFTADSRTHTAGTFYRNSAPNIKLLANDAYTQINFSETATNGLDPRFDVGTFGGAASNFKLFTELVANNEGVSFMQQALPTSSLEEGVIPVGLTTNETKEVAFKIEATNLPQGTYVYIEDKQTGTFTNLVETSYKVTVNANEASTGRFYVHTSAKALSTDAIAQNLANVSIFKSGLQTLSITGLQANKATVNVYSVLGKEVYSTNVTPNGLTKVNLPNLATGIYVVNVTSELGKVSKKIVIE